ncbi:MAG: RNA polymerase sigma factor [Candidatus Limnocylindria bacterium]
MTKSDAPLDDMLLAERIRAGDREALGELYDRYAPLALALAMRVVNDRFAAEDVVHDAFVAIWQHIDRFDRSRGSIRGWLLTVVRNRAIDRVRGRRPTMDVGTADEQSLLRTSPNPTWELAVARISAVELRNVLATLPTEQREAIELAYFGGRTYREIARLTGVPEGTANGRLRLGLAKLRDALQAPMETHPVPVPIGRDSEGREP